MGLPERLKEVQALMAKGDARAAKIYETIGVYLGYAMAHYADFYDFRHALILGRVTTGKGGDIVLAKAREVLKQEFPAVAAKIAAACAGRKIAARRPGGGGGEFAGTEKMIYETASINIAGFPGFF